MKKSKILININEISEVDEYKKIGYTNFLFAVDKFSVGYPTFRLEDIPSNAFILMNRIMDTDAIDELIGIKDEFKRFRGIIFEDLGVYQIFKDTNIPLIWFQNHFATNYNSINFYLDHGCESAIISNELTGNEVKDILNKANKPLVFNVMGKNNIMYSRRTLLSNYNKYMGFESVNDVEIDTGKDRLFVRENSLGTVIFYDEYFNYIPYLSDIDDDKVFMYLVMNLDLPTKDIDEVINGKMLGNDGFWNKKTVYKLSDYDK